MLRNDCVDAKKLRLPYDREVLLEMQGQTVVVSPDGHHVECAREEAVLTIALDQLDLL